MSRRSPFVGVLFFETIFKVINPFIIWTTTLPQALLELIHDTLNGHREAVVTKGRKSENKKTSRDRAKEWISQAKDGRNSQNPWTAVLL
jgi:hypothetical protein